MEEKYTSNPLVNPSVILTRTATTTEEPGRGDQTAGLQDHHQNRRGHT